MTILILTDWSLLPKSDGCAEIAFDTSFVRSRRSNLYFPYITGLSHIFAYAVNDRRKGQL